MADQIKPRYRLGTQYHLDLAKDDATKIPERTLFRVTTEMPGDDNYLRIGDIVVRGNPDGRTTLDNYESVSFMTLDGKRWDFQRWWRLEPLI